MIIRQLQSHCNKETKEMSAVNRDTCTVSRDQTYSTYYGRGEPLRGTRRQNKSIR
jgi:hypothetical protein